MLALRVPVRIGYREQTRIALVVIVQAIGRRVTKPEVFCEKGKEPVGMSGAPGG
jgi:hypothetical protein